MFSLLQDNDAVRYYVPLAVTFFGTILTFIAGIYLGVIKNREDRKSNRVTADASLRDDLLELVNHYEGQLKNKDEHIEKISLASSKQQQTIFELMTEKTRLEIENLRLLADNTYLKTELEKIERKVFYKEEVTKDGL